MKELILERIDKNCNNEEKKIVLENLELIEKIYMMALLDAEKIKE